MNDRIDLTAVRIWNERNTAAAHVRHLLEELGKIKKLLGPEGGYSICKTNGDPIGLASYFAVGATFENTDGAMDKAAEFLKSLE